MKHQGSVSESENGRGFHPHFKQQSVSISAWASDTEFSREKKDAFAIKEARVEFISITGREELGNCLF